MMGRRGPTLVFLISVRKEGIIGERGPVAVRRKIWQQRKEFFGREKNQNGTLGRVAEGKENVDTRGRG